MSLTTAAQETRRAQSVQANSSMLFRRPSFSVCIITFTLLLYPEYSKSFEYLVLIMSSTTRIGFMLQSLDYKHHNKRIRDARFRLATISLRATNTREDERTV